MYLDRNHGGRRIIWDRMFGTFEKEVERPTYGLTKNIESHHPVHIAFHEWKALLTDVVEARSVRAALGYVWHPPGWRADGRGMTSEDIREAAIRGNGT